MDILIILVGLVVALWVLNKLLRSEMPQKKDTSFRSEVPLVKGGAAETSEATATVDNVLDKGVANTETAHESVINIEQSQVESLQSIEASPVKVVEKHAADTGVKTNDQNPEDTVLRSHDSAQLAEERESIAHPYYPTDSVLRRHYESMLAAMAVPPVEAGEAKAEIVNSTDLPAEKQRIPEEATLRRHFLSQLVAEIESELFPRPTDSILKRHYESLVLAKLADRLAETKE